MNNLSVASGDAAFGRNCWLWVQQCQLLDLSLKPPVAVVRSTGKMSTAPSGCAAVVNASKYIARSITYGRLAASG